MVKECGEPAGWIVYWKGFGPSTSPTLCCEKHKDILTSDDSHDHYCEINPILCIECEYLIDEEPKKEDSLDWFRRIMGQ